jgi:hypothetical protein
VFAHVNLLDVPACGAAGEIDFPFAKAAVKTLADYTGS